MRRFSFGFDRLFPRVTFCALFLSGMLSGCIAARSAGQALASLMRMAVFSPVSIVSLSAAMLLPFILAAIAVYFRHTWLLMVIGFFKAFSFSWCFTGIWMAFGSAVYFLLLFSDLCAVPLFCLYSLRNAVADRTLRNSGLPDCLLLVFAAVCVDALLISPLLASL